MCKHISYSSRNVLKYQIFETKRANLSNTREETYKIIRYSRYRSYLGCIRYLRYRSYFREINKLRLFEKKCSAVSDIWHTEVIREEMCSCIRYLSYQSYSRRNVQLVQISELPKLFEKKCTAVSDILQTEVIREDMYSCIRYLNWSIHNFSVTRGTVVLRRSAPIPIDIF